MDKQNLSANKRNVLGRKVKQLRTQGFLPANIYGKKVKSQAVQVNLKDFTLVFAKSGETGLVDLALDGKKLPVLIHNIAYHPITGSPLHADFYQVDLKEKVTTKVPLEIAGEAPAVKDKTGVLLTIIDELEVEALPQDLPDKISVDVSQLTAVDMGIKVKDLAPNPLVKILTDIELEIVKIAPAVSKEAEKELEEAEAQKQAEAAAAEATAPEGVQEAPAEGEEKKPDSAKAIPGKETKPQEEKS